MKQVSLNEEVDIDLDTLIDTRLLIQANSGGGKSWVLRRILEQSHGKVQQIIIDLEGEFSTLRERFDYVIAGKDGDTPTDPRTAAVLAKKLLKLNVSAIIDLYELELLDRKKFVKNFLDSLVNAPKELWHPCMVVIDEAHVFCPEKGQSEASSSVIDLATRGRKRGFCVVLATQRLSKLNKDAVAECNNKLIGRTGLDIDMKRASDELGFNTKEQYLSLRNLNPGEFFAFGPAISNEVLKTRVGSVETTHPKVGSRGLVGKPVPPTDSIKRILSELADLPEVAEEEAKTIQQLKDQVSKLRIQLSHTQSLNTNGNKISQIEKEYSRKLNNANNRIHELSEVIKHISDIINLSTEPEKIAPSSGKSTTPPPDSKGHSADVTHGNDNEIVELWRSKLNGASRKIFDFLVNKYPLGFTRNQIAVRVGYTPRTGNFNEAMALLNRNGLIEKENELVKISKDLVGEER